MKQTGEQKEEQTWRMARELMWDVYSLSSRGELASDYRLQNSLRRAGSAILARVAEAVEREGTLEFSLQLEQARREIEELRRQLEKAHGRGYVSRMSLAHMDELLLELEQSIHSLSNTAGALEHAMDVHPTGMNY